MKRLCVFLSVALFSATVQAATPSPSASVTSDLGVVSIPVGDDSIVSVKKGEAAPFSGQLFSPDTALRWGNWLLQYKLRLKADVELEQHKTAATVELWSTKYKVVQEKYDIVTKDYQLQVANLKTEVAKLNDEIRNPPFYKSVWFGLAAGVVLSCALVGVGIYLAK